MLKLFMCTIPVQMPVDKIFLFILQPLELHAERRGDSEMISITIKRVGDMNRGDHHYIQFFNIIMRKCLDYLDLRLVGRNYFDPHNKVGYHFHLNIMISNINNQNLYTISITTVKSDKKKHIWEPLN